MAAPEKQTAKRIPRPKSQVDPSVLANGPTENDLNKIRDILFGEHVRDLREVVATMQQDITDRLDELRSELESTRNHLEDRIAEVSRATGAESQSSIDRLRDDVDREFESMNKKVQTSLDGLQQSRVSRTDMSKLLGELADKIVGNGDDVGREA